MGVKTRLTRNLQGKNSVAVSELLEPAVFLCSMKYLYDVISSGLAFAEPVGNSRSVSLITYRVLISTTATYYKLFCFITLEFRSKIGKL